MAKENLFNTEIDKRVESKYYGEDSPLLFKVKQRPLFLSFSYTDLNVDRKAKHYVWFQNLGIFPVNHLKKKTVTVVLGKTVLQGSLLKRVENKKLETNKPVALSFIK